MAAPVTPVEILTDIADAIREKDATTAVIPVANYATRIQALPTPPPTGWPNKGRMYRFRDYITQDQQDEMQLVRCDGRPVFESLDTELFNTFKPPSPDDWIRLVGEISGIPNRSYDTYLIVGDKLYLSTSSSVATNSIIVVNTLNGRVAEITGLPSRVYSRLYLVGHRIFCQHSQQNVQSHNSVVVIDTTNDTWKTISLPGSLNYDGFALVGNRLFVGIRNNIVSYCCYIDLTTDTASFLYGLPSCTSQAFCVIGTKLYIGSYTNPIIVIDTAKIGTGDNPVSRIETPVRSTNAFYLAGQYLYPFSSSSVSSLIRINTADDTFTQIDVPNRTYLLEVNAPFAHGWREYRPIALLVGNRLLVGSTATSNNSILRIANTTGAMLQIDVPPGRAYTDFQPIGTDKVYVASTSWANTLVVVEPSTDTAYEITLPISGSFNKFFMNGTDMYLLNVSTATGLVKINTNDDAAIQITGLPNRAYVAAVIAHGRMYLGTTTSNSSTIPVISVAGNSFLEEIQGVPGSRSTSILLFMNEKIYVLGGSGATIAILSQSVLPNSALPVYIKYGS